MTNAEFLAVARAVRDACVEAALEAYEEGGVRGLCHEGRFELAVDAQRQLDLDALLTRLHVTASQTGGPRPDDANGRAPPKS